VWYHITLYDVRFAHDSIYERVFKTLQMITFVAFALVGSNFKPATKGANNLNFEVLSYALTLVHFLMAFQYSVVFICCFKRVKKALIPLALHILVYLAAVVVLAILIPRFKDENAIVSKCSFFWWWIVLVVETVFVVAISCSHRILSFKKSHLMERMHLLTLIVIG